MWGKGWMVNESPFADQLASESGDESCVRNCWWADGMRARVGESRATEEQVNSRHSVQLTDIGRGGGCECAENRERRLARKDTRKYTTHYTLFHDAYCYTVLLLLFNKRGREDTGSEKRQLPLCDSPPPPPPPNVLATLTLTLHYSLPLSGITR